MAHTYESRDEAIESAEMLDIDQATVGRDHETGLWGWSDESEFGECLEGQVVGEPIAETSTALVTMGQAAMASTSLATVSVPAPAFTPREGKIYSVILDGLTYADAVALGVKIARRHKINPAIAAEPYYSNAQVIDHTMLPAEPVRTGGTRERDERGLTLMQAAALDLMLRPIGATVKELKAAGATTAKMPSVQYIMDTLTMATGARWTKYDPIARIEGGKALLAFRMSEVPEIDRAKVEASVRASMDKKTQNPRKASKLATKLAAD
jgi:hypothetical protein